MKRVRSAHMVTTNLTTIAFFDFTLHLNTSRCHPHRKLNEGKVYTSWNLFPTVIRNVVSEICKELSNFLTNREIFNNPTPITTMFLGKNGFTERHPAKMSGTKKDKNWKVYNITSIFKHLPRGKKYYKLFNRDNVKVSYSCLGNFASNITWSTGVKMYPHHSNSILKTSEIPPCAL